MLISVDFDGTITQSSDPNDPGFNHIRPYCKEVMHELTSLGVKFRLLTGRRFRWTFEAVRLCKKWKLPIDVSRPHRKVISDCFIDDKNIDCQGIDWRDIYITICDKIFKEGH